MVFITILVLDSLDRKINSPVPSLRATPAGSPSEVMMTMTTLTANPTSPRRSPTPPTSGTSSFILKELTDPKSGIRCSDDKGYHTSKILRKIPTSKLPESAVIAVVDLLDDDAHHLLIANAQEDTTPAPTFLQEWEAFYLEFKKSITYTLAHSSAASLLPSLIDADEADEDRKIHECEIDELPTNGSAGLSRLRHSVRELEKVNLQLASFVESLSNSAPCQPTLCSTDNNLPHPQPCLERPSIREILLIADPAPKTAPYDFTPPPDRTDTSTLGNISGSDDCLGPGPSA